MEDPGSSPEGPGVLPRGPGEGGGPPIETVGKHVFLGEHQHTLDDKGRVILPARFRDRLAGGVVLAPSQEHCIDVFPTAAFERRVEHLRRVPRENQRARAFLRVFLAGAHPETPDGQGRITVPQRLREYAQLDRELSVNGADETVQIWDRELWEQYRSQAETAFADFDEPFLLGEG